MTTNDTDVVLKALRKEREIIHQRVMQLDRIIKNIKEGKFSNDYAEITEVKQISDKQPVVFNQSFKTSDIKVQILKIFEAIGKAVKLQVIQDEYNRLAEVNYPVRDTMRSLQNSKKLTMIRAKGATRGFLWVKSEWIENSLLLDQYKPDGFDLLYKPEDLIFE
jgi:hypothetical protein